ncbi:MAG: hypothetical protein P8I03_08315 [Thalassotalea sp.]|nr:hypothetical protein [Thalassotalea sp.]
MSAAERFVITQDIIGKRVEIDIDDVKFCELYEAKETLSAAFSLEEKYELLLMNFLELEKEVLSNSAEYSLFDQREYSDFFDIRLKINRRVVNFLTSCRLYVDHAKKHIRTCLPHSANLKDEVNHLFNEEFDQHFEYRFCEKLRNHVQHQSLAVHTVTQGGMWINDQRVETTKVYSLKSELQYSDSFNKKYLAEMPDKVELISVFKKYIEILSNIHVKSRKLIKDSVQLSRSIIEQCISNYSSHNDGDVIGLSASHYKSGENGKQDKLNRVPLLLEWDDVRIKLESKNSQLLKFSHRKVESVDEKPDVLQNRIRIIAEVTRKAIENYPKAKRDIGLQSFPSGACGHASAILGQCLIDFLGIEFDYVAGKFKDKENSPSHAWLQSKDYIVDITADQFEDIDIKVWVTAKSKWHQALEGKNIHIASFEYYDKGALMPLEPFYQKLKNSIEIDLEKLNFSKSKLMKAGSGC